MKEVGFVPFTEEKIIERLKEKGCYYEYCRMDGSLASEVSGFLCRTENTAPYI